ncbi:MAG: T9SS type A sorting domain-containing protein [Flavobacteriales bacterium]|nr:T9SS type A sorting domain-containing protein [Flavobacteriales bacterium]
MKKPYSICLMAIAIQIAMPQQVSAQTPTWSDDVACIVYSHCAPCHHDGGPAHFSLMSYADGYWWRNEMRDATQARLMPPWPADEEYRPLAHERLLTQDEIDIIAAWVDGNAPEGNAQSAPAPPVFSNEPVISNPDITAIMDEYAIPSSTADLYRCFVLNINNPSDSWITALEVVPGNREMVHHVLVFQDASGQAQILDAQDPAPGYTSFGGIGVAGADLIGVWVPGSEPFYTPPGMGIKLLANADIVIQVHYPATTDVEIDSTRVNIELGTAPFMRELAIDAILNHDNMTNGPLVIPANQVLTFNQQYTVPVNATITAIGPHGHLICRSLKSWAVKPGGELVPLIDIPQWDFRWQDIYAFRNPIYLPAGTVLHSEGVYDNTSANPSNPSSPPQLVTAGEATTDEMFLFFFAWTLGLPSDESIVIDNGAHAAHHLDCETSFSVGVEDVSAVPIRIMPNPAAERITISGAAGSAMRMFDAAGRVVHTASITMEEASIDVAALRRGAYIVELLHRDGLKQRATVVLE